MDETAVQVMASSASLQRFFECAAAYTRGLRQDHGFGFFATAAAGVGSDALGRGTSSDVASARGTSTTAVLRLVS